MHDRNALSGSSFEVAGVLGHRGANERPVR